MDRSCSKRKFVDMVMVRFSLASGVLVDYDFRSQKLDPIKGTPVRTASMRICIEQGPGNL